MHAIYEISVSYGSKVIAKVKVDNRQINKQTGRQVKNNMPPIIRSGGIKTNSFLSPNSHLRAMEMLVVIDTSMKKSVYVYTGCPKSKVTILIFNNFLMKEVV